MTSRRLLGAASVALLFGCKDSSGPSGLLGTMGFTYSGAIAGTFNVSGQMPISEIVRETTPWAAGEVVSAENAVFVAAASPRTSTSHDVVELFISRMTVGSVTIDINCNASSCAEAIMFFGLTNSTGASWLQFCVIESGTMTITEITATRVKGTFSGTGTCQTQSQVTQALTVTNGTFDVAITSGLAN